VVRFRHEKGLYVGNRAPPSLRYLRASSGGRVPGAGKMPALHMGCTEVTLSKEIGWVMLRFRVIIGARSERKSGTIQRSAAAWAQQQRGRKLETGVSDVPRRAQRTTGLC